MVAPEDDDDDEYVAGDSEDEIGAHRVSRGSATYSTRSAGRPAAGYGAGATGGRAADGSSGRKERWEDIQRSWDLVREGADGTINSTVEEMVQLGKRRRITKDTTPLQRGIIRHVILVLDLSISMMEKDLRPSRYLLTIRYSIEFVTEFFEQNPISQLGVIGMRDGLAVRISDMSGNPNTHIAALEKLRQEEPKGSPSLQNALEMGRAALFHTPSHGTREVLMIFGALISSDPGDIHAVIRHLVQSKIRVSIIGLAARLAICSEIVKQTNSGSEESYGVALDEQHFRELLWMAISPPVLRRSDEEETRAQQDAASLLQMGFPSRITEATPTLCACHSKLTRGGFLCSRCQSKVCNLPANCPCCGLTLILSTHLARSYHHLFPLNNWVTVSWVEAAKKVIKAREISPRAEAEASCCYACQFAFPTIAAEHLDRAMKGNKKKGGAAEQRGFTSNASESGRYRCTTCNNHFCVDCDVFCHEAQHNCPGCQSAPDLVFGPLAEGRVEDGEDVNGATNGELRANGTRT